MLSRLGAIIDVDGTTQIASLRGTLPWPSVQNYPMGELPTRTGLHLNEPLGVDLTLHGQTEMPSEAMPTHPQPHLMQT